MSRSYLPSVLRGGDEEREPGTLEKIPLLHQLIGTLLTYLNAFLVTTEHKIGWLLKCVSRMIGQTFASLR